MAIRLIVSMLLLAVAVTVANAEEPFESYPHIKCEACLAIMSEVGEKMNETSKVRTSIQSSHRLEGGNERRQDYESSELRAVEILDRICDTFYNLYFLRINATSGRRFFSKDKEIKRAPFYGKPDKAVLGAPSRKLQQYCLAMMDEHDTVITRAIMKERTLDALQETVCSTKLKICSATKDIEKALAAEEKLRAKHLKEKEKKRMKKLAAQRKAEAEEAALNATREAEAASLAGDSLDEPAPEAAQEAKGDL
eukprot:GILI01013491.1.p1 GENE.GILI01013491.1~~GILI01013491.1.p1  ORF type:complete len:252 (+),score=68.29 GILI01013491.1:101-856(+)